MPNQYGPVLNIEMADTKFWRYDNSNCSPTGDTILLDSSSTVKSIHRSSAFGYDTPGWRKLRNSGAILPFTKWDRHVINVEATMAQREFCRPPSNTREFYTDLYRGLNPSSFTVGELMALVDVDDLAYFVQKAAAQISSSGWDALTFLAEIHHLRRMFSGVVTKLGNLSKGLSPGKAHDLWLEGRYGWRILTYDIRDLHELLVSTNDRRTRYRQTAGHTSSGSSNEYNESTSSNITTGIERSVSWTLNQRGTVVADIDVPDIRFNPVTTAWEVTRLSFVVDWLWNVGQGLDAATFLLMAKSFKAGAGYRVDFNMEGSFTNQGTTGGVTVYHNDGSYSGSGFVIHREPSTVSALPRLRLRMDKWKALDLLALIMQRL